MDPKTIKLLTFFPWSNIGWRNWAKKPFFVLSMILPHCSNDRLINGFFSFSFLLWKHMEWKRKSKRPFLEKNTRKKAEKVKAKCMCQTKDTMFKSLLHKPFMIVEQFHPKFLKAKLIRRISIAELGCSIYSNKIAKYFLIHQFISISFTTSY